MEGPSQSVKTVLKKKVIVITPDQLARMGLADKVQNAIAEQLKNKTNSQTPPRAIIREASKLIKVTPLNTPASEDAPKVINGIQDVLMQTAPPKNTEIMIVKSTMKHRKEAKEAPVDQVDHALNHNIKCKLKELLSKKLGGEGANTSPVSSSRIASISPTIPTQKSAKITQYIPLTSSTISLDSSKPMKKLVGTAPILTTKPTQTSGTPEETSPNISSPVSSSKPMRKLVDIAPTLPTKPTHTSGASDKTTPNITSPVSSSKPMKKSGCEPTISFVNPTPAKPSSTPSIICVNIPSSSPNPLKKSGGYNEIAPSFSSSSTTPSKQHSAGQVETTPSLSSSFCTSTPSKSVKKSDDPDDITSSNSSNAIKLTPIKKLGARDEASCSKPPPSKPFSIPHIIRLKKAPDEMVQSYPNYGTYHQLPIDQFSIEESHKRIKSTPHTVIEEQIIKGANDKVQVLQKVVITPPSLKFTAVGEEIGDKNIKVSRNDVKASSPLIDILENIKLEQIASSNSTKDSNTKIAPTILAINEETSEEISTKSSNIAPTDGQIEVVSKENAPNIPKIQINPRIRGFRRKLGLQKPAGISNPRAKLRAMYSKKLQENNAQLAQLETLQKKDEEVDSKSNEESVIKQEKGGTNIVESIHETLDQLAEKHRTKSMEFRAEGNEELDSNITAKKSTMHLEENPIEDSTPNQMNEGSAITSSKTMECTPSLKEAYIINKEVSLNKEEESKEVDDDDDMNVTARSSTKHLEENSVESPYIEERVSTPKRSNVASTSSKAMECTPSLNEEYIINKRVSSDIEEERKEADDDDDMNVTARSSTKHLEENPVESPHIEERVSTPKRSNVASTSSKAMECTPSLNEEYIINKRVSSDIEEESKEVDDDDNINVTARSSTKHLEENPVESPHIEDRVSTPKRRTRRNADVTGIFEFTKTEKKTVIDILNEDIIEKTRMETVDFKAPKVKVKEEETKCTIDDESTSTTNEIRVPKKRGRKKKILVETKEDMNCEKAEEATVIATKTRGRKRKLWISESSDEDTAPVTEVNASVHDEETASASLIASTPTEMQTSCEETPDLKRLKVDESMTPKKRRGRPRKSDVKLVAETPEVLGKRLRSSINYAALENGVIEDVKPIRTPRIPPKTRPNVEEGVTEKKRRGRPKKIKSEENNEPCTSKEIVKEEKEIVKKEEEIEEDDEKSEDEYSTGRQVGFRKRGRKKKPVIDADEEGKEEDKTPRKRGKKRTLNLGPEVVEEYERKYDSMLKYIFKDIEQCLLKKAAESRPEEAAKEKKKGKFRVCAICKAHLKETEWTSHKLRYHNCLAWREGDKPLNFENTNALMIILNQMYKQRKPFYCDSCNAMKKSPNGFLAHRLCCGELPENHDEFKVRCPECPLSIVPFVYAEHLRGHKLKREKEENKAAEEIEKMSESVTEISTHKRRAAAKKANELIQSFSQEEAKGPCNSNNLDNYYIRNQMRLFRFDIAFKRDLTVGGASKCRFVGCNKSFRVVDEALAHLRSCEFVPKTAYICKICSFVYNSEDAINSHLLDSHERCVKRDEDYNHETESEDEDEDFAAHSDSESLVSSAHCNSKKNYKGAKWTPNPNELWKPYHLHFLKQSTKYVEGLSPLLSFQPYQWALEFCDANYNRLGRLLSTFRRTEWTPLNPNYIQNYLPPTMISAAITHVVNSQKGAPKSFAFKKYKLFETQSLCNENILGFCGGPINTMAWAPTPNDQPHCEQILAVSVLHDPDKYHYQSKHYNDRGAIQFWNYGILRNEDRCAGAELEFCLAHELGGVWCMEWCPSGCYETDGKWLGLLAVCSSDSFVYGYSIPQPNRLKDKMFKPAPVFKLAVGKSADWKLNGNDFHAVQLSWSKASGHKYIAAGYSSGVIGLFNLETTSDLLRTVDDNETAILHPYLSFQAHQHGITGLCLHHLNGGNRWMVSSSYDGYVKLWDLERMPLPASVTRRAQIKDLQWLNNALHTIEARDETSIPSCHPSTANIFRNFASQHTLSLMYGNATLDAVSASEWCNIVVQGSGMGEITACAVKNFFPFSTELTLKRLFIGTVNLERISGGSNVRKYADVTKTHGIVFVDEPMTRYHPMAKSSEGITSSRSKFAIPKPDRYPLEAINSIAMNPNRYSFLHTAVGYQAGFVKLVHFKCFTEMR